MIPSSISSLSCIQLEPPLIQVSDKGWPESGSALRCSFAMLRLTGVFKPIPGKDVYASVRDTADGRNTAREFAGATICSFAVPAGDGYVAFP